MRLGDARRCRAIGAPLAGRIRHDRHGEKPGRAAGRCPRCRGVVEIQPVDDAEGERGSRVRRRRESSRPIFSVNFARAHDRERGWGHDPIHDVDIVVLSAGYRTSEYSRSNAVNLIMKITSCNEGRESARDKPARSIPGRPSSAPPRRVVPDDVGEGSCSRQADRRSSTGERFMSPRPQLRSTPAGCRARICTM